MPRPKGKLNEKLTLYEIERNKLIPEAFAIALKKTKKLQGKKIKDIDVDPKIFFDTMDYLAGYKNINQFKGTETSPGVRFLN